MSESDFVVKDRRHFDTSGDIKESAEEKTEAQSRKGEETEKESDKNTAGLDTAEGKRSCDDQPPLPEVNFSTFIFSLSTSALMNLGELPDPNTRQSCRNIPLAKQTIDILGMLKDKTRGNLDQEEENLLSNLLYELRMKYVSAVKR